MFTVSREKNVSVVAIQSKLNGYTAKDLSTTATFEADVVYIHCTNLCDVLFRMVNL